MSPIRHAADRQRSSFLLHSLGLSLDKKGCYKKPSGTSWREKALAVSKLQPASPGLDVACIANEEHFLPLLNLPQQPATLLSSPLPSSPLLSHLHGREDAGSTQTAIPGHFLPAGNEVALERRRRCLGIQPALFERNWSLNACARRKEEKQRRFILRIRRPQSSTVVHKSFPHSPSLLSMHPSMKRRIENRNERMGEGKGKGEKR